MTTFSQSSGRWQPKVVRKGFPTQYKSFPSKAEGQIGHVPSKPQWMTDHGLVQPEQPTYIQQAAEALERVRYTYKAQPTQ